MPRHGLTHIPAITEPVEVGRLLRATDAFKGTLEVQSALELAPLFFARPGELTNAELNRHHGFIYSL